MDPAFILALLRLDGVGRVTAHRLLDRFPTYEALRACPREQVLLRLKGAPRAEQTVGTLFDAKGMEARLADAAEAVSVLANRHIEVVTPGHPHWPPGLMALPYADRPLVLYAFGDTAALAGPSVALFGRAPLAAAAFEAAQALADRLLSEQFPLACGAAPGFDVALHKRCTAAGHPCVMVAAAGLAKLPPPARPSVSAAVKAGGVLVSSFAPTHGPFPHDDTERALVQAALSGPSAFFAPHADSPEARALSWALSANRPVFGLDGETGDPLPERVHHLARPVDLDWVVAAAGRL